MELYTYSFMVSKNDIFSGPRKMFVLGPAYDRCFFGLSILSRYSPNYL